MKFRPSILKYLGGWNTTFLSSATFIIRYFGLIPQHTSDRYPDYFLKNQNAFFFFHNQNIAGKKRIQMGSSYSSTFILHGCSRNTLDKYHFISQNKLHIIQYVLSMQIQVVYIFTELITYIVTFISWDFLLAFK